MLAHLKNKQASGRQTGCTLSNYHVNINREHFHAQVEQQTALYNWTYKRECTCEYIVCTIQCKRKESNFQKTNTWLNVSGENTPNEFPDKPLANKQAWDKLHFPIITYYKHWQQTGKYFHMQVNIPQLRIHTPCVITKSWLTLMHCLDEKYNLGICQYNFHFKFYRHLKGCSRERFCPVPSVTRFSANFF